MAKRITPGQIRRTNRQQVFQYIYDEKKVSQQDIAYALQLSRPTVAAALTEMEEMGMILKSGYLDSDQIGRKAAAYSIDETFRVAVGVEIMRHRMNSLYDWLLYHPKIVCFTPSLCGKCGQ